ncbi:uncharacterized protein LOC143192912 [Rhynchophorus ferrugineus]|uniref:uncharacterized protein LOC143192912 n=1 Tax=Rhynchophorus ferrugineus TaxID=354439 RepID=UPI003FCE5477
MTDFPLHKRSHTAFYADDTTFFTTGYNNDAIRNSLQVHLNQTIKWYKFWRLQINPSKTQAILFNHKKEFRTYYLQIDTLAPEGIIPRSPVRLQVPMVSPNPAPYLQRQCHNTTLYKMLVRLVCLFGTQVWDRYVSNR